MTPLNERSALRSDLRTSDNSADGRPTPPLPHGPDQRIVQLRLEESGYSPSTVKKILRKLRHLEDARIGTREIMILAAVPQPYVSNYRHGRWSVIPKEAHAEIEEALGQLGVPGYTTRERRRQKRRERMRSQYLEFHRRGMRCPPANDIH